MTSNSWLDFDGDMDHDVDGETFTTVVYRHKAMLNCT